MFVEIMQEALFVSIKVKSWFFSNSRNQKEKVSPEQADGISTYQGWFPKVLIKNWDTIW